MTKKDFKTNVNPADMFISAVAVAEPEEIKPVKVEPKAKPKAKAETKSKRLNLLIQPSLLEDISKIATMNKDSVNNLINKALADYRDLHRDTIEKYNKVFEG